MGSSLIRTLTGGVVAVLAASPLLAASWIKDPGNGCATSNPFPNPNESIRWFGSCRDGKLDGRGTLTWYRDGAETERNEGTFKDGELDGFATTRALEGYVVYGQYKRGIRHGQFMTVRNTGDHIKATYLNGQLVSQSKLTPQEVLEWNRNGGPQLIAKAPQPPEDARAEGAPAEEEPPITGRTAVASPSRLLAPPHKGAARTGAEKPLPGAGTVKPSGNFTFGTQVAEAIAPPDAPPAPAAPRAAAPPKAEPPPVQTAAPQPPAPPVPAVAAPRYELGTQVAGAIAQPTTLAATAPSMPSLPAAGIALSGYALHTAPTPAAAAPVAPQVAAPVAAPPAAPAPAPSAPVAAPAPPLTASQIANLPVATPIGAAPQARPAAPASAAPPPALPASLQPAPQPLVASTMPPGPVGIAPPGPTVSSAAAGRRPPWMAGAASEPVPLSNAPVTGATPPPLPTSGLTGAAAPLAGPPTPYVPQPYKPQAQPAPPPVAVDMSPTAASRQYLAAREQAMQIAETQPMQALLSYRAMQSGSFYPPPVAPPAATPAPAASPSTTAVAAPGGSPETLFNQAYKLEMSGRFREAEQTYEQIMLSYSSTQTAMLANERLNGIRRNTRDMGVRIAERERENRVVAINEPRTLPRHGQGAQAGHGGDAGAGDVKGGMVPNLTGLAVCSQSGLYESDSRWCGQVLADDGVRLSVEVRDIILPGFGSIGIGSSKCTGGQTLNWFSKGSVVRVPRSCMELKG